MASDITHRVEIQCKSVRVVLNSFDRAANVLLSCHFEWGHNSVLHLSGEDFRKVIEAGSELLFIESLEKDNDKAEAEQGGP